MLPRFFCLTLILLSGAACSAPFYREAPRQAGFVHSVGSVPNAKDKLATREFAESASMGHWAAFAKQESATLQGIFENGKAGTATKKTSTSVLGSEDIEDMLRKVSDPRVLRAKTILFGYDDGRCYALVKVSLDTFLKAWKEAVLELSKASEKVALQAKLDKTITLYKRRNPYKIGVTLPPGKFSRRQRRVQ
ncbi:MAG: hypothetical protein P1V97_07120 [Planctomycetota bacterium]|nr:hypothetical protein [Planctomycetota bacterium]